MQVLHYRPFLPVAQVASHLGLNWKTVKAIDKAFLERDHGETDTANLRVLAVDEIAIRKGHRYMTVVLDHDTGRVVWMGEGRRIDTLTAFFDTMSEIEKRKLEAVAIDMWPAYIRAIREAVPHVKMVYDLFHVVQAFNRVICTVRSAEHRRAHEADKAVYKGTKYLLLRRKPRRRKDREHLQKLLALNETLNTVLLLRDLLPRIWRYRRRGWAERRLREWCALARTVPHPAVQKFAASLERHADGILNHCDYPIHTGRIEGTNNTIKVIKRRSYGFHDNRYFTLKVKQAFPGN